MARTQRSIDGKKKEWIEYYKNKNFSYSKIKDALHKNHNIKTSKSNISFHCGGVFLGSFQFFGSVVDTDVVENIGERMGGFVNWGQQTALWCCFNFIFLLTFPF